MLESAEHQEHLSDYERAVCYYTLPRVISPVTFGTICVYCVLLAQTLAATCYGWYTNDRAWTVGGVVAFLWLIALGSILFLIRAFVNEVRERRALAQAHGMQDAVPASSEIPDPFGGHVLLRHRAAARGRLFSCTENDASLQYFVDSPQEHFVNFGKRGKDHWNVRTKHDTEYCHIQVLRGLPSFTLDPALPGKLSVTKDDMEIARIVSRFSFQAPTTEIQILQPNPRKYVVRRQGIYHQDRLVGRMYSLRQSNYLDVEESHFNEGILAYFVVWS